MLFGKVRTSYLEGVDDGVEAGEQPGDLRLYGPSPLSIHALLPECGYNVSS